MATSVTVAIPVYKRLDYLPVALRAAEAQDHPDIDLLVSDNAQHGDRLREIVEAHVTRPYRLRHNDETVNITEHFNQLVEAAEGEYFVLLCDDDDLSPDYVSLLSAALDANPEADVALSRLQVIDEEGRAASRNNVDRPPPPSIPARDFVRMWCRSEYSFVCFVTNMARTAKLRRVGGYPDFPSGTSIDNGALLKLAVGREVAFVNEATFRYRVYEESLGLGISYRELARGLAHFLDWLDEDPVLRAYAAREPEVWSEIREDLVRMTWGTYRHRWKTMYRRRLSIGEWLRAAFAMPFVPAYYRAVIGYLLRRGLAASRRLLPVPGRG